MASFRSPFLESSTLNKRSMLISHSNVQVEKMILPASPLEISSPINANPNEDGQDVTPRKLLRSIMRSPLQSGDKENDFNHVNLNSLTKAVNVKIKEEAKRRGRDDLKSIDTDQVTKDYENSSKRTPMKRIQIKTSFNPSPSSAVHSSSPDCRRNTDCACSTCNSEFEKILDTPIAKTTPSVKFFKQSPGSSTPNIKKTFSPSPSNSGSKPPLYKSPRLSNKKESPIKTKITPSPPVDNEAPLKANPPLSLPATPEVLHSMEERETLSYHSPSPFYIPQVHIALFLALMFIVILSITFLHTTDEKGIYVPRENALIEILKYLELVSKPEVYIIY